MNPKLNMVKNTIFIRHSIDLKTLTKHFSKFNRFKKKEKLSYTALLIYLFINQLTVEK